MFFLCFLTLGYSAMSVSTVLRNWGAGEVGTADQRA